MLAYLHIRNLATVSQLEMEFCPGLNAITGETGAGKSVIMGALQALLGERAEKSLIRRGETRCEIAGEFALSQVDPTLAEHLQRVIEEAGAPPCQEARLWLRRVITPTSSRAYINDSPVTMEGLRAVGNFLVDIHGPHDHQSLLGSTCQLELVDAFAGLHDQRRQCEETFRELRQCRRQTEELCRNTVDLAEQEILAHQMREITDANLDTDEEKRLHEQYRTAANARTLIKNASDCRQMLSEGDGALVEQLRPCVGWLGEIARLAPESGGALEHKIEGIVEQIEELNHELRSFADTVELDAESLHQLEQRLEQIQSIRRKYGGTIEAVLARAEQLKERLDNSEMREERLRQLAAREKELQAQHQDCCRRLTRRRREAAGELAEQAQRKLQVLGFAEARFQIDIGEAEPGPRGADRAEFIFAPNPGEGILPLRKIVSSGEMARVMLGLKAVFSEVDQIPVLVFDEVDANIGGRTANQVAEELDRIGDRHQIFCITHLPQIAAAAKVHYRVDKKIAGGRTVTELHLLDTEQRLHEIVRMMGGDNNSEVARKHALTMIEARRK